MRPVHKRVNEHQRKGGRKQKHTLTCRYTEAGKHAHTRTHAYTYTHTHTHTHTLLPTMLVSKSETASGKSVAESAVKADLAQDYVANQYFLKPRDKFILAITFKYWPHRMPKRVRFASFNVLSRWQLWLAPSPPSALLEALTVFFFHFTCLPFENNKFKQHSTATMNSAFGRLRVATATLTIFLMLYIMEVGIRRGRAARDGQFARLRLCVMSSACALFHRECSHSHGLCMCCWRAFVAWAGGDECLYDTQTARTLQSRKRQWKRDFELLKAIEEAEKEREEKEKLKLQLQQQEAEEQQQQQVA